MIIIFFSCFWQNVYQSALVPDDPINKYGHDMPYHI